MIKHEGFYANRLNTDNPREVAFAEEWYLQNDRRTGALNGTLAWLLGIGGKPIQKITQHDASVAATVIQWLGSNVGFSFLEEALGRRGYKIVRSGK